MSQSLHFTNNWDDSRHQLVLQSPFQRTKDADIYDDSIQQVCLLCNCTFTTSLIRFAARGKDWSNSNDDTKRIFASLSVPGVRYKQCDEHSLYLTTSEKLIGAVYKFFPIEWRFESVKSKKGTAVALGHGDIRIRDQRLRELTRFIFSCPSHPSPLWQS